MSTLGHYSIEHIDQLPIVAERLVREVLPLGKIFTLNAPMGAGKTTLINAICQYMGIDGLASSPTFSIVNEYSLSTTEELVYHFDCYRLEHLSDALNLGFEDYIYSGSICFIEWPDIIAPLLPEETIHISIDVSTSGYRSVRVSRGNK